MGREWVIHCRAAYTCAWHRSRGWRSWWRSGCESLSGGRRCSSGRRVWRRMRRVALPCRVWRHERRGADGRAGSIVGVAILLRWRCLHRDTSQRRRHRAPRRVGLVDPAARTLVCWCALQRAHRFPQAFQPLLTRLGHLGRCCRRLRWQMQLERDGVEVLGKRVYLVLLLIVTIVVDGQWRQALSPL